MQNNAKCGKIETNTRWLYCPACKRGKVQKLLPNTRAERLIVYCRLCRTESVVDISP